METVSAETLKTNKMIERMREWVLIKPPKLDILYVILPARDTNHYVTLMITPPIAFGHGVYRAYG